MTYPWTTDWPNRAHKWTDIVTVEPTLEPICVDDVKLFADITRSDLDALIGSLITSARRWMENYCHRAFVTQTRQLKADWFPGDAIIDDFRAPLASITSVVYTDLNGDSQTMSSAQYQVDATSTPGRLGLVTGYSWPSTKADTFNAVIITYVAGVAAASVPTTIKDALKAMVKAMFEGCSLDMAGSGVAMLLNDYRVRMYA